MIWGLWWQWLRGWVELFTGLVTVLSFGCYHPGWSTTYIIWRLKHSFRTEAKGGG